MNTIFDEFHEAQKFGSGALLSQTLIPISPPSQPTRLREFYESSNPHDIDLDIRYALYPAKSGFPLLKQEGNAWIDIYKAFWKSVGAVLAIEDGTIAVDVGWLHVYDAWKEMTTALVRGYTNASFRNWTIPCLYVAGKFLRLYAIMADKTAKGRPDSDSEFQDDIIDTSGRNSKLEDAARVINGIFKLCISDRAPLEESRKWGIYYTTNLLFKTYFKLNSVGLSKNILRALEASNADMPPLEAFPKSHIVTFKYYRGVIHFLEEDYVLAEKNLTQAWHLCHRNATKNRELILTYLIPCHLLTTHTLPTSSLLRPFPRLRALFDPLAKCIRRGDLTGFEAALAAGEDEFVKRRIYLTLERGRDVALRNLFRKVFIAGGFEESAPGNSAGTTRNRRTRIPVQEFVAAIGMSNESGPGEKMENDEVECLLANLIYKDLMRGYISRDKHILVLSKKGSFPGTGV